MVARKREIRSDTEFCAARTESTRDVARACANAMKGGEHPKYEPKPVDTAAIRLPPAHEFSRNGERFQAKASAPRALRERLCDRAYRGERLRDLRNVLEHVETEHREWLRLMIAVSW